MPIHPVQFIPRTFSSPLTIRTGGSLTFEDNVTLGFGTANGESTIKSDGADTIWQMVSGGLTIGLGASAPSPDQDAVHIWSGTAGAVTAVAGSKVIIESDGNAILQILVPAANKGGLYIGDPGSNSAAYLEYAHNVTRWQWGIEGSDRLLYSAGAFAFQEATTISATSSLGFAPTDANGSAFNVKKATSLLSALSGATATATNLIPANALLLAVVTRVTTLITGATSFDIGDGSDVDRWGATIDVAASTTTTQAAYTAANAVGANAVAATSVVLTANGSNFTAGAVRVTAYYIDATAPTS